MKDHVVKEEARKACWIAKFNLVINGFLNAFWSENTIGVDGTVRSVAYIARKATPSTYWGTVEATTKHIAASIFGLLAQSISKTPSDREILRHGLCRNFTSTDEGKCVV